MARATIGRILAADKAMVALDAERESAGVGASLGPAPVSARPILEGKGWALPSLLSVEECDALMVAEGLVEKIYSATETSSGRFCDRKIVENPELAESLFSRVSSVVPLVIDTWKLDGVHEEFRLIRYEPGQYYGVHIDASRAVGPGRRTFLTLMVYLNDDFTGGDLVFHSPEMRLGPVRGLGVVFLQDDEALPHEGESVREGSKWILRGDVCYARETAEDSDEEVLFGDDDFPQEDPAGAGGPEGTEASADSFM
jgi:hypothetical protein